MAMIAADTGAAAIEPFASELAPEDLRALLARGTTRSFRANQALFHEGQQSDRVVLLRSGRVKVVSNTPTGREVVLAFRGPGELVGEQSAIDHQPRSATILAVEAVEAVTLTPQAFREFLVDHPRAALVMLRMLSLRLRDADAKRVEFSGSNTLGRVAVRLLELCDRYGEPEEAAIRIALPISQEELAGWTGSSIESVARALQTMRELRWIATKRREIRVLDLDALRSAAP
jgi:CRP/FNR family transcriptional regulator, cyclic AMP receptor protein